MYLIYVDECGDSGIDNSPTRYYVLTGLVVNELRWQKYLDEIIYFRRHLSKEFGLKLREEFHASKFITRPKELIRINRYDRLLMIKMYADLLSSLSDLNFIKIKIDKKGKPSNFDIFGMAWKTLIQRFENTISHHNFPGPSNPDDRGIILPDNTENKKLITLLKRMRRYNPIPHDNQYSVGY